jgi:iron-sulfur cluster repair protein YtfE (RIC family)
VQWPPGSGGAARRATPSRSSSRSIGASRNCSSRERQPPNAPGKGGELLETLTAALNAHELIEEKVLYLALQSHPQARDVVLEGYQEHHVAGLIVDELLAVATDNEEWGAKFKVLKENIEHHIQEEERELFPAARRIFSREELRELAARMLALRPPPRPRARPRR